MFLNVKGTTDNTYTRAYKFIIQLEIDKRFFVSIYLLAFSILMHLYAPKEYMIFDDLQCLQIYLDSGSFL